MHRPSLHRNWFSVQDAKGNFAWKLVTTQKTKYRYLYTHPTWRCFEYTLMTHTHSFWCNYCQLWTYFTPCSSVFIVNFEKVNADWVTWVLTQVRPLILWLATDLLCKSVDCSLWCEYWYQASYDTMHCQPAFTYSKIMEAEGKCVKFAQS